MKPGSYKISFIGDSGVGKTCIINRKVKGTFNLNVNNTIGSSHFNVRQECVDFDVELCLWDTAGQEKYQSLVPLYLRDTDVLVVVGSYIDDESIKNIPKWIEVSSITNSACIVVVVNKIDIEGEKYKHIDDLRAELSSSYENIFFVSALDGSGIDDLFFSIAKLAIDQRNKPQHQVDNMSIKISEEKDDDEKKKGCC